MLAHSNTHALLNWT